MRHLLQKPSFELRNSVGWENLASLLFAWAVPELFGFSEKSLLENFAFACLAVLVCILLKHSAFLNKLQQANDDKAASSPPRTLVDAPPEERT